MTKLIATSVVRGSHQGESHGGVYIVDIDNRKTFQTIDWNTANIDWQGRGWDRGLRGIAFDGERIFIAASDELFTYDPDFKLLDSWTCPYLKHCHEIAVHERRLFLTSTGFDSILAFDLDQHRFSWGLYLMRDEHGLRGQPFNPESTEGPLPGNEMHVNNVFCTPGGMYISGLRTGGLLIFNGRTINEWVNLPQGVHNARPFRDGVLFNDTQADVIRYVTPEYQRVFNVPRYEPEKLTHTEMDDSRVARQAFARGLCQIDAERIATGSSPSTISVHDIDEIKTRQIVTLTFDIRNAIHGLEVWPYD